MDEVRLRAYTSAMRVLLLTKDLLLGSQINGAASAAGCDVQEVLSANSLRKAIDQEPAKFIVIDLTCPGVRDELGELVPHLKSQPSPPTVIAYGPHVQEGALATASEAGCDRVMTRGQLHRELGSLFGSADGHE